MNPACIHIVHCEDHSFSQESVVKHNQRSIEGLELVIPQDVEDLRHGRGGIADQLAVEDQHPEHLSYETGIRPLIASQIKKAYSWLPVEFWAIQLITSNLGPDLRLSR